MRVHNGLVELGYTPILPTKRRPTSVRDYIAYSLPNGRALTVEILEAVPYGGI